MNNFSSLWVESCIVISGKNIFFLNRKITNLVFWNMLFRCSANLSKKLQRL